MKQNSHFVFTSPVLAAILIWIGVWYPGSGITLPMNSSDQTYPLFNELRSHLEDVPGATAYRYNAADSAGHSMDTAKIIADPAGGYLAVYHTNTGSYFQVSLATSSDLVHWQYTVRPHSALRWRPPAPESIAPASPQLEPLGVTLRPSSPNSISGVGTTNGG